MLVSCSLHLFITRTDIHYQYLPLSSSPIFHLSRLFDSFRSRFLAMTTRTTTTVLTACRCHHLHSSHFPVVPGSQCVNYSRFQSKFGLYFYDPQLYYLHFLFLRVPPRCSLSLVWPYRCGWVCLLNTCYLCIIIISVVVYMILWLSALIFFACAHTTD